MGRSLKELYHVLTITNSRKSTISPEKSANDTKEDPLLHKKRFTTFAGASFSLLLCLRRLIPRLQRPAEQHARMDKTTAKTIEQHMIALFHMPTPNALVKGERNRC